MKPLGIMFTLLLPLYSCGKTGEIPNDLTVTQPICIIWCNFTANDINTKTGDDNVTHTTATTENE